MFKQIVPPPIPRLFARLGLLLFLASFGLTACIHGCEACGPPPGYSPDVTPLVDANGTLYYIAHTTLYAFQDHSGTLLWHYTNPALDHDTPVVSDGVIYMDMSVIASSNSDQSGIWIYALRGNTGQVLWHTRISASVQQIFPPEPQVIDGMVYAQSSGETSGSTFFALRASDGKVLWSEGPPDTNGESATLMFATSEIAYLASYSSDAGYVMARRTSDGALLWHYTFPSCHMVGEPPVNTTIYISGYCATGEETDAFQAETGQLLWRVSLPEGLITVTPTPTVVYVDDGANSSTGTDRFFALDANTGQLLWKREIPQSVGTDTHIWAANGTAVYTTINGVWSPLGARDGKPIWKFPSDGQSAPGTHVILQSSTLPWLLSHDLIYVADNQQFEAFQASTGKLHWNLGLPTQEYLSFLTLSQGVIYLSRSMPDQQAVQPNRQKQEIYAIGADTGKVLWHTIQTQQPQVMTQDGVYFAAATGQPYHYSYSVFALQSGSGKHMWTYQV